MHAKGDYVWLYEKLAATPDDGLDELRARYRQRVRELHPDRHPELAHDPRHSDELVALNTAFDDLIEFHRRTGRLPGAARPAPMRVAPAAGHTQSHQTLAFGASPQWSRDGSRAPRFEAAPPRRGAWLAVGLVFIGIVGLATGSVFDPPAPALSLPSTAGGLAGESAARVHYLERGLNRESVRRLEGEPFLDTGSRFEYGPSYVEFKGDKVVGWYSSPMQPLHVREGEEKR